MAAIVSTMFHNHLYGCHVHVQAWVFEWLIDYQYTIEWHIDADELFVGYGSSVMYICGGSEHISGHEGDTDESRITSDDGMCS